MAVLVRRWPDGDDAEIGSAYLCIKPFDLEIVGSAVTCVSGDLPNAQSGWPVFVWSHLPEEEFIELIANYKPGAKPKPTKLASVMTKALAGENLTPSEMQEAVRFLLTKGSA